MKADGGIEVIKRLFSKKGSAIVVLGIIAGILLMIIPQKDTQEGESQSTALTSTEYCALLESKAESLILELENVDDCTVVITLDTGYRYSYATDTKLRESQSGKETEQTTVLADAGNGETAILVREEMPRVSGVAVVCQGASYETQYSIIELISALFDIKSNRICVKA